jgi:hypothetical protein
MSQINKAQAIEYRKHDRAEARRLAALNHIEGLQPPRRELKPESRDTAKPLFA